MCTTRELVAQNLAVLRRMAKYTNISSTSTAEDGGAESRNRKITEQVRLGA
jgi:ATP-dependent RNA helicase DDX19/DBP5